MSADVVDVNTGEVLPLNRLSDPRTNLCMEEFSIGHTGRAELEAFIKDVFARSYDADIHTFYPHLLGLRRPDKELAAVAGIRPADSEPLFCESYMESPIEVLLSKQYGKPVQRNQIVEVGNLAPSSVGQARWLIATMTAYLRSAGFTWVVFTAVPVLYNAFRRMELEPIELANANPLRIDTNLKDQWGSYYDGRPMVYAGNIEDAFNALNKGVCPVYPKLLRLWNEAIEHGKAANKLFSNVSMIKASC